MVHNFLIGSHSLINISFLCAMQNICLIYQLLVDNHSKSLPSLENDRSAPAVHFQMTVIVLFSWYWDASTHRQL